jgi:hypothetical protein
MGSMAADAGGWSNAAVLRKRRMREACIVGRTVRRERGVRQ